MNPLSSVNLVSSEYTGMYNFKFFLIFIVVLSVSCSPVSEKGIEFPNETPIEQISIKTPVTARPKYDPGELVDYIARSGDTLPALSIRFNSPEEEIRQSNPGIPLDATTLPPGMPMKIPIYYRSFWGSQYLILPDSQFVNGPASIDFNIESFVQSKPGWLKDFHTYAQGASRSGVEVVQLVATNYSVSPRVLLTVMEYRAGALSDPTAPVSPYPLGIENYNYPGLYMQLVWIANILNHGYYGWRTGLLYEFEIEDGTLDRPDPWQTAATVAFQYLASRLYDKSAYTLAIGAQGISKIYTDLFGDPWIQDIDNIPVSLQQPALTLPFMGEEVWAFTGGPHTGWGTLFPWAALDFAPGAEKGGCVPTTVPTTAMAAGIVVRSQPGVVMIDMDGDADERTGWNLLYLHVATTGRVPAGTKLETGDIVGYPSCEGGITTGTHIHIARKYNGEWIPADSVIPFNLDGWIAHNGSKPYDGTLTRNGDTIFACECSDVSSQLRAGKY